MMTRDELFSRLKFETEVLQTPELEEACKAVDRADFVEEDYKVEAYEDYPLPIPEGQTISQPTTVFFMLELLGAGKGDTVADIGAGSGYTTALLSTMVGEEGNVTGFEVRDELVDFANSNLASGDFKDTRVEKSSEEALREHGPYDKMLISAEVLTVPDFLDELLKEDGVAVFPLGESIIKMRRKDGDLRVEKEIPGFVFVPFIQE